MSSIPIVLPPPLVPRVENSMEFWVKPSFPYLKQNVDGALNLHNGLRGLGVVFGNERGE